ncbi:Pisatin demethylase 18 [Colletotrichum chlorophyti]|uniref:Pisatin demethylase 18 n=1 Tax=Colletotrichum chlorophyti TaxID=708187 RepID=A0A1Q8S263_9PEZI|nr:Pisatin demethylase 18 [Colletotrichum chlorophyti]
MEFSLSIVAVSVLFSVFLTRLTVQSIRSPLRNIPGPFWARITDGWYLWRVYKGSFEEENIRLHRKNGAIVRYGPNRYSIDDPEAAKTIYGLGTNFPKSSWYSTWASPGQWSIFSDQSIIRHAHNRRVYQATYAMSSLPFVDECADLFALRLLEISKSGLSIDMRHWLQCYAFDVIGMITYGKRIGFLDRGDDVQGVISALEDHLGFATLVGIFPSFHRLLNFLKNKLAGAGGAGRRHVLAFTSERIREAQTAPKSVALGGSESYMECFLAKFLAKHSADPNTFTNFHVLSGCVSNMVAGSDTTAISLSAVLYYLVKNPACLHKLRSEIDSLASEGRLSESPSFKDSQDMPYLQAVIKEALRMHPATGLPLERVVPEGGATLAGRFFPEGTIVGINAWVAHCNRRVFGEDADEFNPDRWLVEEKDKLSLMNGYYMPFGLGSRTCIGRHVSMLEMTKLIPRLLRDFDFWLDPSLKSGSWHTNNYWFVKPLDFKVRVQPRHLA